MLGVRDLAVDHRHLRHDGLLHGAVHCVADPDRLGPLHGGWVPAYLRTCLLTYVPAYVPACLRTCLLTYLPTLVTYLPTLPTF